MQSSVAEVQAIAACQRRGHEWLPERGLIFGAILVFARCLNCGTYQGPPDGFCIGPSGWVEREK